MQKFPRRWTTKEKIDFLQRKIIINSILYYELNTSRMTDKQYDETCKQLLEFQKDYDGESQYGYTFYDFDGTTGFDIYGRLKEQDRKYLFNIASHLAPTSGIIQTVKKKKKGSLF